MAGSKISALGTLSSFSDTSLLPTVDSSTNYKMTGLVLSTYTNSKIPTASSSVLGLVKIDNSSITLNGSNQLVATAYSLPTASTTVLGGVKIDNSTITLNGSNQLVAATQSVAGSALTGSSLASGITSSSLTSVSTLTSLTTSGDITLNTNNKSVKFTTTTGANVSLIQQNDDNLVLYSTNAAGAQRAVWSVFGQSSTSSFTVSVPTNLTNGAVTIKDVRDTVYAIASGSGTSAGTITPDCANGNLQTVTLTGSITLNAFANPVSGQSMTIIITQPSSGGPYTLTSSMKWANANKTLSTAANAVDMVTVSYIGSTYYASLITGFA